MNFLSWAITNKNLQKQLWRETDLLSNKSFFCPKILLLNLCKAKRKSQKLFRWCLNAHTTQTQLVDHPARYFERETYNFSFLEPVKNWKLLSGIWKNYHEYGQMLILKQQTYQ